MFAGLGIIACAACADVAPRPDPAEAPPVFYTVTAEIALSRHAPRVAALEYAAAVEGDRDVGLLERAAEVTTESLQPSLTLSVATRWIDVDPGSVEAHRAAARAALILDQIDRAAAHYRVVLATSPHGTEAEFEALQTELADADTVYGARRLADQLAILFPASAGALRLQAYAALRADDPAAAARTFAAALQSVPVAGAVTQRHDMTQGLWRARILAGDREEPLAQARAALLQDETPANRLDYALLLLAAQEQVEARTELLALTHVTDSKPVALRLLGLIDFQQGNLPDAAARFAELITTGKFLDDAVYYLGLIAERHRDFERALRLYADVQAGDNALPALLRAATVLRAHGAAPAAEDLLDRLVEEEPQRAPEILVARARIYEDAGELPRAATVLENASLQYPDSVEIKYAEASLHEEQGNVSQAIDDLRSVVTLRPQDPAALNAYGYTLADHHRRLRQARQLIETAYAAAPKSTAILDSFGWVLFRQGRAAEALPYLSAAYADDRGGDIAAHLGEVLWSLHRATEAEQIWSEAAVTDADNALLKATRQRLHASN